MLLSQMESFGKKINPKRNRDLGQLRYAMRSALNNMPYIRNFIVVVNNKETQIPSWLNATHPRIRIIAHKEIWDNPSDLPSMNTFAIEWALMNIPNLTTIFLNINDDFAVQTAPALSSIWSDSGKSILFEDWESPHNERDVGDDYGKSLAFVRKLYDKKYGFTFSRRVGSHTPIVFNTTIMKMIRSDLPDQFVNMYRSKPFRSPHDMVLSFTYQQWIRHHLPYIVAPKNHYHFKALSSNYSKNKQTFDDIIKDPRLYMCLQDDFTDGDPSTQVMNQIEQFYENMFPTKAPWEITPY